MTICANKTDSYGKKIMDNSSQSRDGALIRALMNAFKRDFSKNLESVDSSVDGQVKFVQIAEEAIVQSIYHDESLQIFSDTVDHYNRRMCRYIVSENNKNKYIIDVYGILDAKMVLSKPRRFYEKYLSLRPWKLRLDRAVDPRIVYKMRIWYTPIAYYDATIKECTMNLPYSGDIEKARSLIGVPHYINQKDKNHERTDFDIRRALFNEISGVIEKGNGRKGILTTRGNDNPCI